MQRGIFVMHLISISPICAFRTIPPVRILAGSGIRKSVDGVGLNASFDTPLSVAVSHTKLYALVTERTRIRQVFLSSGSVETLAGSDLQGFSDGIGSRARFFRPIGVAISKNNIAYIADWNLNVSNHKIRVLDIASKQVTTLRLFGDVGLKGPSGLALSADDSRLFVADTWWVLRVDLISGNVTWLAGSGYSIAYQDGFGRMAFFVNIVALAVGKDEKYILVADSKFPGSSQEQPSNSIRLIDLESREVVTVGGGIVRGYADGIGTNAVFDQPNGIALDQTTNLALITDYGNQRLRSFHVPSKETMTLAGSDPPIPAISARRTSQGNALAMTGDGQNVIMINVTGNSVQIVRCPSDDCEPNFYKSPCLITSQAGGDGRCIKCPNNTVSGRGSTSQLNCTCDLGLFGPATACTLCPEGTYKDFFTNVSQGKRDCLPCNLTGYSSPPGSRSKMNCTLCDRGYYRLNATCVPCQQNTYKTKIGDSSRLCLDCPSGSTSAHGSISCICGISMVLDDNNTCVCNAGYHGREGGPCSACPTGKYKNVSGSSVNCSVCPANTYSEPAQSLCVCNAGFFANDSQSSDMSCTACPSGMFKNFSGDQHCIPCRTFESGICNDSRFVLPNPTNATLNATNTTVESFTYYESFAPFVHASLFSSLAQGGLFWFSCTPLIDGQCLRCPSVQLDAIPGMVGISACSCRAGMYSIGVEKRLEDLHSLSVSPNTTENIFLSELSRTKQDLAGKEICRACPNGTFKGYIGPGPCSPCPMHSTSNNQSIDVTSCLCNAGFSKVWHSTQNFTCEACPLGFFKENTGDMECISCPIGKSTHNTGATRFVECSCTAGYYQKNTAYTFCNKCERGKFKNFTGNDLCYFCPEGFYQDQLGTSVCKSCAAGTYNGKIGQKKECSCVGCPQNMTTIQRASTDISLCMCMAGYYGSPESIRGNGSCIMCPAGSAKDSIGFADGCVECKERDEMSTTEPTIESPPVKCSCKVGWTGPDNGKCQQCSRGEYKPKLGPDNCTKCPEDHFSDDSLSSCISCPANSALQNPVGYIENCECLSGFYFNDTDCIQCDPGTFKSSIGPELCLDCEQGKYSDNSYEFCQYCSIHQTSPNRSSSVHNCTCNAGYTPDLTLDTLQLVCNPCSAGKYKSLPGFSNCTDNPLNSTSEEGAVIFTCNSGFAVNKERDGCAPCESFYKINAVADKPFCEINEYFESQQCSCVSCPMHTIVYERAKFEWDEDIDINGAEPNVNGKLTGAVSVSQCVCDVGYTCASCLDCEACDACVPCASGTYKDNIGNMGCTTCPTDSNNSVELTSSSSSFDVTNCTCPPGFIVVGQAPDITCSACEPGKYSNSLGSSACSLCPIQKTSLPGSSICVVCKTGDVCVCDVGYTLNSGEGLLCIPCVQGKYKNTIGSQACVPCLQSLHFQPQEGQTSCRACTPTRRCPNGMYWKTCSSVQDGECVPCFNSIPSGSIYSGPGFPLNTSKCPWKCANGFQLTTQSKCEACPAGKFKGPNQLNCTACPHYATTLIDGQVSCTRCINGYYLSGFSESGHSICKKCSLLHTSIQSSSRMGGPYFSDGCKCDAGFFGCSWNCSECPPGTYKDFISLSTDEYCQEDKCIDCPDGTYNTRSGQTSASSCRPCGNSSFAAMDKVSCVCSQGLTFVPGTGQCIENI